jgi:PKD repeat protein
MNKSQSIFIQRVLLILVICAGLCAAPAIAAPEQNTQTSVAIKAVILATPPQAAFTGNPIIGNAPLFVHFTDQSTGQITSWLWNFGDGSTSTQQNVTHVYTIPGKYTVNLTVTGPGGSNTSVKINYITVTKHVKKPVARFDQDVRAGRVPLNVHFTDKSLNNPTSFLWEFGDGSNSTVENPSHVYTSPGFYRVRFTAANSAGSDTAWGFVIALPQHWWWH